MTSDEKPRPRFGAAVLVMNEWRFLPAVLGQLLKVCDRVALVRSEWSFSGAPAELQPLPALDPRVEVVQGKWSNEAEARNAGTDHLADCEYIFTLDSDEIMTVPTLEYFKREVARGHRAMGTYLFTYWKTPHFRVDPPERICATVVIHRSTRFEYLRKIEGNQAIVNRRLLHHLSYVRTDEELKEKIRLFGHAKEVVMHWYEQVWKGWDENPRRGNLHPTHPRAFAKVIPVDDKELMAILDEHKVEGWW